MEGNLGRQERYGLPNTSPKRRVGKEKPIGELALHRGLRTRLIPEESMDKAAQHLAEKVESLKNMLTAVATGGSSADDGEYYRLRSETLRHAVTKDRMPSFVRTCRTLHEFWGFIKPKFTRYDERREFIRGEFDPVLTYLEGSLTSPADDELSQGLQNSGAEFVHLAWDKALRRRDSDPEGAITAARSLLESVCKYVLDELGETYDEGADLPKLYGMTAAKLKLAPSQHTEEVFRRILGGCHSVVEGLGSLRNRLSDAHGKGKTAVKPHARHAQLAVNVAGSMAMFLIETFKARRSAN